MQREYVASRRWARPNFRRGLVEGASGFMKDPSGQRLRRGQNRLPGLAMASITVAVKVASFNEDQLRIWHDRTGLGPADHPLLQPDPACWRVTHLTEADAKAIDARNIGQAAVRHLRPATPEPGHYEGPYRIPGRAFCSAKCVLAFSEDHIVEVAGIEPASDDCEPGLLRAQLAAIFSAPAI